MAMGNFPMARHDCVTLSPGGSVSIMGPNGVYNGTIDPTHPYSGDGEDFYPLGVIFGVCVSWDGNVQERNHELPKHPKADLVVGVE